MRHFTSQVSGTTLDDRLTIVHNSKYFVFKYSNCVGMKPKDVCNTPGIIIFVPDEVYFFPDGIKTLSDGENT